MYTYRAKIISVYDGDTVTALVDLGFGISTKIKVRLKGINTPELRGPIEEKVKGIAAREFLKGKVLNKDIVIKNPGEHIFIPLEAIHRIQNSGKKPVKIIDAQVGSILKESDIVRYQDVYGRVN